MKVRADLSIDSALLEEARELGLNLSALLEDLLRRLTAERRDRQTWLEENREALADANAFLERHGLWSDGQRQF